LELPPDKPLTLAAYDAGPERVAYLDFVAGSEPLPDMPLFLKLMVSSRRFLENLRAV
jgi:hypothetical protein